MGRRRRKTNQSEFAKQMLQSQRTKRDGDSSIIKDKLLPKAAPTPASVDFTYADLQGMVMKIESAFGRMPSPTPVRKQTEPIIAYRGWQLVRDERGPALQSVTANVVWDGPILRSGGKPSDHIPWNAGVMMIGPASDPAYGIYAYREAFQVMGTGTIWGEIEVFGKVVVHERGLRAECARIRRLVIPRTTTRMPRAGPEAGYITFTFGKWSAEPPTERRKPDVTDETLAQLAARYGCDVRWYNGPFD